MYTYETFLANQKKNSNNDTYKKLQINTVESERKQSTASISDISSVNKGKNYQIKYSPDNHDIEIEKLKEIYNSKKNELDEEKNKNEKNIVLIDSKDKEIEKLVNDVKYYSFHIKKYKSDAERALEDAIGYQKIVKILEIQLNEYKEQLDEIKNPKVNE